MTDKKILWRMVHAGFLVCIGLFVIGHFWGIATLRVSHVLTAFTVLFLVTAFRSMALRGRILFLAGMLLALSGAGVAAGGKNILQFLQSYFYWLMDTQAWNTEWVIGYELIQSAFFALLCYFAQMIMERDFRFKIATFLALFAALLYFLFTGKEVSRVGVVFMICYALMLYVEGTQIYWKKEKEKSMQAYMLWIMPFFVVYFFLMLWPDVPQKPYDWQIVRTVYGQLRESFLKFSSDHLRGNGEDYDLSLSGFSESGRLKGKNEERQDEIMTVESKTIPVSNLYLTGMVYDTFDGRQWEQRRKEAFRERYMDADETLSAVKQYDREYQTDYLAGLNITIRYRYFRSAFVFAPLKTWRLGEGIGELDFNELGGTLYFDKRKGYGTEYEVSFYQLNAGQEAFWQFLEEASAGTGKKEEDEEIQRYRRQIYEDYQEPATLSGDVERYLEQITKDARTDIEKLRAIEAELSSFSYTRMPGELPETVASAGEFLDYFLLESREGYCTYFATAFVLLARAEGLPARYVQGFCVPVRSRGETLVYSNMAHAWPEVYFEGVGWIPFEPTPGYLKMRYSSWEMRKERENGTDAAEAYGHSPAQEAAGVEEPELPEEEYGQEMTEDAGENHSRRRFLQMLASMILWAFSVACLLVLLNRLLVRFRYRKMELTAKFQAEVKRNLRILAFMGIVRGQEETLEEFQNRAEAELGESGMLLFLQSYEDFLYGDKEPGQTALEDAKRGQEALEKLLKSRKRLAYVYYRLVLGRKMQ